MNQEEGLKQLRDFSWKVYGTEERNLLGIVTPHKGQTYGWMVRPPLMIFLKGDFSRVFVMHGPNTMVKSWDMPTLVDGTLIEVTNDEGPWWDYLTAFIPGWLKVIDDHKAKQEKQKQHLALQKLMEREVELEAARSYFE